MTTGVVTTDETTPENVISTTISEPTPSPPICPSFETEFFPHPKHCDQYYMCIVGQPHLLTCPKGSEFSPESRVCIFLLYSIVKLIDTKDALITKSFYNDKHNIHIFYY